MDFVFDRIRTFSCVFPPYSMSDAEKTCVCTVGVGYQLLSHSTGLKLPRMLVS